MGLVTQRLEDPGSADIISGHEEGDFDPRQQLWRFLGGTHSAGPLLWSSGGKSLYFRISDGADDFLAWPGSLTTAWGPARHSKNTFLSLGFEILSVVFATKVRHLALLKRYLMGDGSPCPGLSPDITDLGHRARRRSPLSLSLLICNMGL